MRSSLQVRVSALLFVGETAIFLATMGAVVASTLGALFFAGRAMNRARAGAVRARSAGLALLCLCAIAASAAAGFWAAGALLYLAST